MNDTSLNPLPDAAAERTFAIAAELFALMSTPMRLKIISALCQTEKTVSALLEEIATTQPNMSQHLGQLYRAGILAKRRDGVQVYYRVQSA
ncbi:MAG TPA: metalloregulator ArsR/SmtB family transcription factor, partial [Burkholderiaceae bacterium]